jgi:alkaline phosphatase D
VGAAGPTGGLAPELRYSEARRAAAYQAYFESMPTFRVKRGTNRIYKALRFGRTVDLILLDQRQYQMTSPVATGRSGRRAPTSRRRAASSAPLSADS